MTVTTRVLDCAQGRPAASVPVRLDKQDHDGWTNVAASMTDLDGQIASWRVSSHGQMEHGLYRLTVDTNAYFAGLGASSFYQEITVTFVVSDHGARNHVVVLIAPHGYMAYRES